jgi:glycerophosphoryl diester phosphodiesterase
MLSTHHTWPYPTLFAHRGGGSLAPENTLSAMKVGRQHGYLAFEFDVKLSKDGVAILMHDATLERTTNGRGAVADTDVAALEMLDAGSWYSNKFEGERIPRFSAIATFLHGYGLLANVEIKPNPGQDAETGRVIAGLCAELWGDRHVKPLFSSFSVDALRAARSVANDWPMGLLVKAPEVTSLELLRELRCVSLHCHQAYADADMIRAFHAAGFRVLTYTVNEPERAAQLIANGVDGIFTDALDAMARRFPAALSDAGKPVRDAVELDMSWLNAVPPMP